MKYFTKIAEKDKKISKVTKGTLIGATLGSAVEILGQKRFAKGDNKVLKSMPTVVFYASLGANSGLRKEKKSVLLSDSLTSSQKLEQLENIKKKQRIAIATATGSVTAPTLIELRKMMPKNLKVADIVSKYSKSSFKPVFKGLSKFGATLTSILDDLPTYYRKLKVGADPEIIGITKKIGKRVKSTQIKNVKYIKGAVLDPTVRGVELNPKASSRPIEVVKDLKEGLKRIRDSKVNRRLKLTNLAQLDDVGVRPSVAGGHIHMDVPADQIGYAALGRTVAGSLTPHYVVPGANLRAGASISQDRKKVKAAQDYINRRGYGKQIMDTRGVKFLENGSKTIEARQAPTWMGSEDLARVTLETSKLTAHNPETYEMTDKFMKKLIRDTEGKTKNLHTQKAHKDVMNYLHKLYTKVGVSGDKGVDNVFNMAAKASPKVNLDIYKNWGI